MDSTYLKQEDDKGRKIRLEFTLEIGGMLKHKDFEESILKHIFFMRNPKVMENFLFTSEKHFNEKDGTMNTIVDFFVLKSFFFNELTNLYDHVIAMICNPRKIYNVQDTGSQSFLVSISEENKNKFVLKSNNERVLKSLIGKTILGCLRVFDGSIEDLVSALEAVIADGQSSGFQSPVFEYFISYTEAVQDCINFFSSSKNLSSNLSEEFLTFFKNEHSANLICNYGEEENRELCIEALKCSGDLLKLCTSIRLDRNYTSELFSSVSYDNSEEFIVHKCLVIKFTSKILADNVFDSLRLFNEQMIITGSYNSVEHYENSLFITFEMLAEFDIHYIEFVINQNQFLLSVSEYTIIAKGNSK